MEKLSEQIEVEVSEGEINNLIADHRPAARVSGSTGSATSWPSKAA